MKKLCLIFLLLFPIIANAQSFSNSKKILENQIYNTPQLRQTIYCGVFFDKNKNVNLPPNINIIKYKNRIHKIEWEHVVPQSKLLDEVAKADMYNLYPAIGSVNASRSNYDFAELSNRSSTFGSCDMKIYNHQAEPPDSAKGNVARIYFYMADKYQDFALTNKQQQMFDNWSNLDPVDKKECLRTKLIEQIQKNENTFIKQLCIEAGLWN